MSAHSDPAGVTAPLRFAVIADTHVNPSDDDRISPFESHRLTNARLRHTVEVLRALHPAFVVHVGDMVHPVPESVSYPDAVARFREAVSGLGVPLHLVPGNHDTGDKPADYVPAGAIRPEYVALYTRHFGAHWHAFDAGGCRFVTINTSLLNSGLDEEAQQAAWLEDELARHAGGRIFLFVHYPPFVAEPHEPGHYDNVDEPARSWLLALIERHGVEAVFTGHVHNFFLNRHGRAQMWSLPSTAFVRADYTEVFHVGQPPEHENGRNDTAKLGVLVVDVYPDRIVPGFIRTHGGAEARSAVPRAQRDWPRLLPAAGPLPTLGIDLRQSWATLYELPYSSMLDEFQRKRARNDYPLLALCEMGVRQLRLPLHDLADPTVRSRMQLLAALGLRFTVFAFGVPDAAATMLLAQHAGMLDAVELVLRWPPPDDVGPRIDALVAATGLPIALSRFWNASGASRDGKQIKLLVDHGFTADDPQLATLARVLRRPADRLVFRIDADTPAREGIAAAIATAEHAGSAAQVHLRLADDSPARGRNDEWLNGARALEAALCAHARPGHRIFIDTLADVDRGYFPRIGLIDRRSNPRLAARALRNLNGLLSGLPPVSTLRWQADARALVAIAACGGSTVVTVLPHALGTPWTLRIDLPAAAAGGQRTDLGTGAQQALAPAATPAAVSLHDRDGQPVSFVFG